MADEFYPITTTTRSGYIQVTDLHAVYWEEAGNPGGLPLLVVHGGPGTGSSPVYRQLFDPERYRIITFDQRGCGRSTPSGECTDNTTSDLVDDMETLRQWLAIDRWVLFGGSWGATLALNYAQHYPQHVVGLLLRGTFLGSVSEIDWFFEGARRFHPELWLEFCAAVPGADRDPLGASHALLFGPDPVTRLRAAHHWCALEMRRAALMPSEVALPDEFALAMARLECHYFRHACFLEPNTLLDGMDRIAQLPLTLVHGRYDLLCPPETAFAVLRRHRGARLHLVPDAGHGSFEPGTAAALRGAADTFLRRAHGM